MPIRKTLQLRLLLLFVIIITLVILCSIFISQYRQYSEVEKRLNIAYANNSKSSPTLYRLFSTFSEVDNLFRLYANSFDDENLKAYQTKLDTLSQIINSLDTVSSSLSNHKAQKDIALLDQSLSLQYISLKKQIEELILFADEKLPNSPNDFKTVQRSSVLNADSAINRILNDTIAKSLTDSDTIVLKKQGLFKRIFRAKDDTVLNKNNSTVLNINQIDIVHKNIENIIRTNEATFISNYQNLRRVYLQSKEQERKLLTSNYNLINNLKNTIENIRELEFNKFREAEKEDYILYKYNINKFRVYAIMALFVIILMLSFIIYYQYVVSRIERKLRKEKIYASQLAEEKTNLLANISHEIRTPLNSLKGVIKLLTVNKTEDIDHKLLSTIEYDINNINNTVNDILNLSKIESDSLDVVLDDVYLSKIIDDTVGLHKYQAEQKGLQLINENTLDPMLRISSNEFRLRQIVSNLINNAIKYTNKGSITVVSRIVKGKIIIDVIDTGEGIAEDKLDQIFRKYYTVDGEQAKVGFGLGLHICELLAKQIGSKLLVKSQLGVGSTFSLKVPYTPSKNNNGTVEKVVKKLPEDLSIVLIDDNRINLLLAKQLFKDYKNVELFEDPEEAINYITEKKPNLVITDVHMPKLSGWEVLEKIKSNKDLKETKVMANSAEQSFSFNKNASYQFDGVLEKGFDLRTLSSIYYN